MTLTTFAAATLFSFFSKDGFGLRNGVTVDRVGEGVVGGDVGLGNLEMQDEGDREKEQAAQKGKPPAPAHEAASETKSVSNGVVNHVAFTLSHLSSLMPLIEAPAQPPDMVPRFAVRSGRAEYTPCFSSRAFSRM